MSEIHWSFDAIKDFEQNIKFLEKSFTEIEVQKFIDKTDEILNIISKEPKTFQSTEYKNIHSVPIVSQITLYYQIINKHNVELIRFWNNYQNPENINL